MRVCFCIIAVLFVVLVLDFVQSEEDDDLPPTALGPKPRKGKGHHKAGGKGKQHDNPGKPKAVTKKPPTSSSGRKQKRAAESPAPGSGHWGPTSKGNHTTEGIYIEVMSKPDNCTKLSKKGDYLTTEYIGTFTNGTKFDSTYDRKQPMKYRMGDGEVIVGCEIATMGMCAGEKRRTIIPPKYAYGDKDYGSIPAGSTLQFEIVLTELIEDPFAVFQTFMKGG